MPFPPPVTTATLPLKSNLTSPIIIPPFILSLQNNKLLVLPFHVYGAPPSAKLGP
jgi:hypothetical protein